MEIDVPEHQARQITAFGTAMQLLDQVSQQPESFFDVPNVDKFPFEELKEVFKGLLEAVMQARKEMLEKIQNG